MGGKVQHLHEQIVWRRQRDDHPYPLVKVAYEEAQSIFGPVGCDQETAEADKTR